MLGLLSVGLPKKAIALALAAVVLATSLVLAPKPASVPLVDSLPAVGDFITDNSSASAHRQQSCHTYTTWRYYSGYGESGWYQTTETVCQDVPHTHQSWWRRVVLGVGAGLACGGFAAAATGGNVAAGIYVGAACSGAVQGAGG